MALAVEAALTAVELVDAGWSRLTRGKTRSQQAEEQAALEDRALVLEGQLAKEKVETRKLQAAVDEYRKLLLQLHRERGVGLESLDLPAVSQEGTAELIRLVEERFNSPEFLDQLLAPADAVVVRGTASGPPAAALPGSDSRGDPTLPLSEMPPLSPSLPSPSPGAAPACSAASEVSGPSTSWVSSSGGHMEICSAEDSESESWQWVTAREMKGGIRSTTEPCSGLEGEEDYELVEGDDVVDGISLVLARFIAAHPEYKGLSAEELQKAISAGFKNLKGRGVIRALWDWSKIVYKASRWASSAYNVYRHPLMVRAIALALLSTTRMVFGFAVA